MLDQININLEQTHKYTRFFAVYFELLKLSSDNFFYTNTLNFISSEYKAGILNKLNNSDIEDYNIIQNFNDAKIKDILKINKSFYYICKITEDYIITNDYSCSVFYLLDKQTKEVYMLSFKNGIKDLVRKLKLKDPTIQIYQLNKSVDFSFNNITKFLKEAIKKIFYVTSGFNYDLNIDNKNLSIIANIRIFNQEEKYLNQYLDCDSYINMLQEYLNKRFNNKFPYLLNKVDDKQFNLIKKEK